MGYKIITMPIQTQIISTQMKPPMKIIKNHAKFSKRKRRKEIEVRLVKAWITLDRIPKSKAKEG